MPQEQALGKYHCAIHPLSTGYELLGPVDIPQATALTLSLGNAGCSQSGRAQDVFNAELIENAARFRSSDEDPSRSLTSCPALVLNADYTPLSYYPLSLWPWQTAIKAVFLDRVDIVASYDREVHSPSLDMKIPSVIALRQYVKQSEFPAFTRFNVFLRDRFQCQYCGSGEHLTFDHMIPRRLGGRTTWENIITACAPCNMKKGGRTPKQAAMPVRRAPIRPTSWQLQQQGRLFPPGYLHDTWRDWLYWDIELEA
jgi:5-methylcytosine-specific restriction endonuclease McrA